MKFTDKEAIEWFENIKNYKPTKPILFVPCASQKPIQEAFTHWSNSRLGEVTSRHNTDFEIIILTEPLTIIPYDRKDYPFYEYPPSELKQSEEEKQIFIDRLAEWLKNVDVRIYAILYPYHKDILLPALEKANKNIDAIIFCQRPYLARACKLFLWSFWSGVNIII